MAPHIVTDVIAGQTFERTDRPKCPLCGEPHPSRPIKAQFGATAHVAVCPRDRIAYQTPRPSPEATLAYMNWRWGSGDAYADDLDAQLRRAEKQLVLVRQAGASGGSLLDFGAGAGAFVSAALNAGWKAEGVDRSDTARAKARDRLGIELHAAIPDSQYDVITLWDVIEHLRDPADMLATLRPHLNPGGLIMLETGNWECWKRIANGDKWHVYLFDHHFYFSPSSLGRIVVTAGYDAFRVLDANRTAPRGLSGLQSMPGYTVRSWAAYATAMLRWPHHGNIDTLVAVARRPA